MTGSLYPFPETVVFNETGEERKVRGWCAVCVAGGEVYGGEVVSPSGLMHIGMTGGDTKSGKNARVDGWRSASPGARSTAAKSCRHQASCTLA